MSLNSLTSNRVARESRSTPQAAVSDDSMDGGGDNKDVQNALSALVEYVPTETVTLYLATLSALPAATALPWLDAVSVYVGFAVLTPILYALIYAGKRRAAGKPRWPALNQAPWWPMIAATIAFLAWGLAVPDAPFFDDEKGRVLSGLLAIFVSTGLGVLGRFFGSPQTT